MMHTIKVLFVGLICLLYITTAATVSQAGTSLYTGSWIAESFGNDKVGIGTDASLYFAFYAIPFGYLCHDNAPICSVSSTPVTTTGAGTLWAPLGPGCRPLTAGEKPRPAKGGTLTPGGLSCPGPSPCNKKPPLYRNPAHFTGGGILADDHLCYGSYTVSSSPATAYLGPGDPLRGEAMKGAPVQGGGNATTTGGGSKFSFKIPAATGTPSAGQGMFATEQGSFPGVPPYIYSYTYAQLQNQAGEFGPGKGFFSTAAGPSTLEFKHKAGGNYVQTARVKDGANRFGGVMRLLGSYTTKVCYFYAGGCGLGYGTWAYEHIGAAGAKAGGVVTASYTTNFSFTYYNTALGTNAKYDIVAQRWPWTTGTVTVSATPRGPHKTFEVRKGFDNRTGAGVGTVQLVSPILTQWLAQAASGPQFETGGVAVMQIRFVPEPGVAISLICGMSLLVILKRFHS